MTKIQFLRHVQSAYNASRGSVDEYDDALSEHGKEQARGVLGDYDIVGISPLRRCRQTLENSRLTYKEIITVEEAREIKLHKCDFKEGEELLMETTDEMYERMEILLRKLRELMTDDKRVLLLAHQNTVAHLTSLIQGRDMEKAIYLKNAQIVEFDI